MAAIDAARSARGFRVQRRELEGCSVVECFARLTSQNVPLLKDAMREACGRKTNRAGFEGSSDDG
jgi:hypothetical protein